jgi:hypothetical protein
MAKTENGILSPVLGKVGPVVGSVWKGRYYLRSYVKPMDKKSIPQLDYRDKVKFITNYGKFNYQNIVKPFMSKACQDKVFSPWNLFLKVNLQTADLRLSPEELKISYGVIRIPTITKAEFTISSNNVRIEWDTSLGGGATPSDKIYLYRFKVDSPILTRIDFNMSERRDEFFQLINQSYSTWENSFVLIVSSAVNEGISITNGSVVSFI